jgi:RimJ/RimL family protein N-acetyltransferase
MLSEAIATERLTIRPFRDEDLAEYLSFMTDERATRYLLLTEDQKSEAGARELLFAVTDSYSSDSPIFAYAIALSDDRFIGSCGISEMGALPVSYGRRPPRSARSEALL